ncbi:MAG: hypothetical protein OXC00_01365 [Acidimicrobiaceae bacterium]|nr:hypothetical protein [Acidimicrobiaceae bacterium]
MLEEIDRLAAAGRSFAFETTLAGRGYLRRIEQWRSLGYRVTLIFRSLQSPDQAIARVRRRVAEGGHSIPEDVIRRRFDAGIDNSGACTLRESTVGYRSTTLAGLRFSSRWEVGLDWQQ